MEDSVDVINMNNLPGETPSESELIDKKFGDYEVQQLLGGGASAEVYLARDRLDRLVALKILKKRFSFEKDFADMFRREATIAAKLNHDHIISIYDRGEVGGLLYIATEYATEGTLEDYLRRKEGVLSRSEVRNFVQQIAEALDFAHTNGIIHRDVKPSNILLSYNNRIKLADFGIARAQQPETERRSTVVQGTAVYMAPEQANSNAQIDGRVDIYALSVVVYQMLARRLPFGDAKSSDFADQIYQKRTGKPKEIPDVPAYVQQVIFKALSPTPDLRHRSVKEFAEDLIKAIDQWEATTAVHQDKRDLIGTAMLAMEQEDWQAAKDYLERAQKLGTSDIIERNLNEVNRHIRLQDEWARVNESFARADWAAAISALKRILHIEPQDEVAPAKLAEAKKQIELNALYEEGESAFDQEDYALAVERFQDIYQQSPEYRDVAQRLQEFKRTQIKDEFNRLRVEALWALVEKDLEEAKNQADAIDNLELGRDYGANTFLKRFNELLGRTSSERSEQTTTMATLKETLKVRDGRIDKLSADVQQLKGELGATQNDAANYQLEIDALKKEFADRLYEYITDLQYVLSFLEGSMALRLSGSAREPIEKLHQRIREIATRGQQLQRKTTH